LNLRDWLYKKRGKHSEEPEIKFISLPLTSSELLELFKTLENSCRSEQAEIAKKEVLCAIRDRILRFAVRQGAWWDDRQKTITHTTKTMER
jgi:hypothetical protein